MKKKINIFFIVFFTVLYSLNAEAKTYTNEDKGYSVFVDISLVGENLEQESINDYSNELFDWSASLGKEVEILQTIPEKVNWGINKGISEFNIKKNETYLARIMYDIDSSTNNFKHVIVLFTLKSNRINDKKIETIIKVIASLDNTESNTSPDNSSDEYENKELGYKGSAQANYLGINLTKNEIKNYENKIYEFVNRNSTAKTVNNFTKEEEWLINQALNKYSFKENESYIISVVPFPKSMPAPFIAITAIITINKIEKNGNFTYTFIAYEE